MKKSDILKLVYQEFKFDKQECILSTLLHTLIFTSAIFLFTISFFIEGIADEYMKPVFTDGYMFTFNNFSGKEIEELEEMGFYDIYVDEEGGVGTINSIENIWNYKIKAAIDGKDIWSNDVDDVLTVILFIRLILSFLGICLIIVMINNMANSFSMKIINRKKYITMLFQLGVKSSTCCYLYNIYFGLRNIIGCCFAIILNFICIELLNIYMKNNMYIYSKFPHFSYVCVGIFSLCLVIQTILFLKKWKEKIYVIK